LGFITDSLSSVCPAVSSFFIQVEAIRTSANVLFYVQLDPATSLKSAECRAARRERRYW